MYIYIRVLFKSMGGKILVDYAFNIVILFMLI